MAKKGKGKGKGKRSNQQAVNEPPAAGHQPPPPAAADLPLHVADDPPVSRAEFTQLTNNVQAILARLEHNDSPQSVDDSDSDQDGEPLSKRHHPDPEDTSGKTKQSKYYFME